MATHRFDDLLRRWTDAASRRRMLGALVALTGTVGLSANLADTAGGKNKKGKKKRRKRKTLRCKLPGESCANDCCGGLVCCGDNVCHEAPLCCGSAGTGCTSHGECCAPFSCNERAGSVCLTCVRSSQSCTVNEDCCLSNNICAPNSCGVAKACCTSGGSCTSDCDCCLPAACISGVCN
jgi:hypothetical protein